MMPKPRGLGGVVDSLYVLREKRLALNREADEIKEREAKLREQLFALMTEANTHAARGAIANASRYPKTIAIVKDPKKFLQYVLKEDDLELISVSARLEACQERWESKLIVPGVVPDSITKLSLTKLKSKK